MICSECISRVCECFPGDNCSLFVSATIQKYINLEIKIKIDLTTLNAK